MTLDGSHSSPHRATSERRDRFLHKNVIYLNAKVRKMNSRPRGEFVIETSGFPSQLAGRPESRLQTVAIQPLPQDEEITDSSLTRGIKLGTIQYFTIQYKPHLSRAFHAWHLKALYDPFFKKEKIKKNLKEKPF